MFGEFEEGGVFFADAIENADGPAFLVGQPNDFAAGAAEFALQRHDAVGRRGEMVLEEFLENVHCFITDTPRRRIAGTISFSIAAWPRRYLIRGVLLFL